MARVLVGNNSCTQRNGYGKQNEQLHFSFVFKYELQSESATVPNHTLLLVYVERVLVGGLHATGLLRWAAALQRGRSGCEKENSTYYVMDVKLNIAAIDKGRLP